MNNKPSFYAIIPANVRYDKELTPNAKLLYGEITALCNQKGYCWSSNRYFAELYDVSINSVSNWIKQLTDKGYIKNKLFYKKNSKEVDQRRMYISQVNPPQENLKTSPKKLGYPPQNNLDTPPRNFGYPPPKNLEDNTTINTTINNTDEVVVVVEKKNNNNVDFSNLIRSIDELLIDYKKDDLLLQALLNSKEKLFISEKNIFETLDDFVEQLKMKGDTHKTEKDFKSHFLNWCRTKRKIKEKEKTGEKRKRLTLDVNDLLNY